MLFIEDTPQLALNLTTTLYNKFKEYVRQPDRTVMAFCGLNFIDTNL